MLTELELNDSLSKDLLLESKVKKMFEMQHELNKIIHPEWYSEENEAAGWDFQRAIAVELAELMDHFGYKWWKHHSSNKEQCQLEVIDIAHFYISYVIQKSIRTWQEPYAFVSDFTKELKEIDVSDVTGSDTREFIDHCMVAAASKQFRAKDLNGLINIFGITPNELCNTYIIKNTLNIFRARNGYKNGAYKKVWNWKEDNEVLVEIVSSIDEDMANSETFPDFLYDELTKRYQEVLE